MAREVIEAGIRVRYADYKAELDGAHYLEKIIQIPFALPPIAPESVAGYMQQVTGGNLPDPRCETVFTVGLEPNPRRIKRTLNIFLLLWRLSRNRADLADTIKPVRLAKIVIIQHPACSNWAATWPPGRGLPSAGPRCRPPLTTCAGRWAWPSSTACQWRPTCAPPSPI